MKLRGVWIFLVLHCLALPGDSLICFSCMGVAYSQRCNTTEHCSAEQVCFLTVHGGIYDLGCTDRQVCSTAGDANIIGRSVTRRQAPECYECCSTDRCNSGLCRHQKPTTCVDDASVDCAKLESLFHICKDIHQASLVCPKFCRLCKLVDGGWAAWSDWSTCDVTCSKGVQSKIRTCTDPAPSDGGLDCVGNATETQVCQNDPCPVHGKWSLWSSWGSCSVTCDVGMQRRDRSCSNPYPSLNGDHCFGESRDDRLCMPGACSDGGWSDWESWQSCSVSCGVGFTARERTCSNPRPSLLGRSCDGSAYQVAPCNQGNCPAVQVAFTAYGALKGNSSNLIFPNILINYGGGYNNLTGKFICPVAGIYHFASTLTKIYDKNIDEIECYLHVNSRRYTGIYVDPYGVDPQRGAYSVTISGTVHLNQNDVVNFANCDYAENLYNDDLCSFNGFLITPDN